MNLTSKRWADVPRVAAHEVGRPRFAIRNPYVEGMGDFEVQPIYDYYGVAAATAAGIRVVQVKDPSEVSYRRLLEEEDVAQCDYPCGRCR